MPLTSQCTLKPTPYLGVRVIVSFPSNFFCFTLLYFLAFSMNLYGILIYLNH